MGVVLIVATLLGSRIGFAHQSVDLVRNYFLVPGSNYVILDEVDFGDLKTVDFTLGLIASVVDGELPLRIRERSGRLLHFVNRVPEKKRIIDQNLITRMMTNADKILRRFPTHGHNHWQIVKVMDAYDLWTVAHGWFFIRNISNAGLHLARFLPLASEFSEDQKNELETALRALSKKEFLHIVMLDAIGRLSINDYTEFFMRLSIYLRRAIKIREIDSRIVFELRTEPNFTAYLPFIKKAEDLVQRNQFARIQLLNAERIVSTQRQYKAPELIFFRLLQTDLASATLNALVDVKGCEGQLANEPVPTEM